MALTYDQLSAITEKKFIPKMVDNIFDVVPLLDKLKGKIKKQDGGLQVLQPLNYAQMASVGWFSGADTLDNTDTDVFTSASFDWGQIYASIPISRRDELRNSGDSQKVNFVKSKVQVAEKSLADTIATALYNSGSDTKAIVGARTFVTTSSTYGGISQSTYSWWQGNVDSSTTTLTIAALRAQQSAVEANGGNIKIWTATSANFDRLFALLQPQQRFMGEKEAKSGFTSLMFCGAPFVIDTKVPSNSVYGFDLDYLDLYVHKDENFRMEPFQSPVNQAVKIAHIFACLVLASSNNRMHCALTALTA